MLNVNNFSIVRLPDSVRDNVDPTSSHKCLRGSERVVGDNTLVQMRLVDVDLGSGRK